MTGSASGRVVELTTPAELDALLDVVSGRVLGLVGAPGSGKSTLAGMIGDRWKAVQLPMDGFHLADVALESLGLADRKGAPETFDAAGYAAALARVGLGEETVWVPAFERDLEQPIAGSLAVPPGSRVVTEGNYLLLEGPGADPAWQRARSVCEEVWFVEVEEEVRRSRLLARHVQFGKSPAEAEAWMRTVDDPNAGLVSACRARADRVVRDQLAR